MNHHSREYEEYMKSEAWQEKKREKLESVNYQCWRKKIYYEQKQKYSWDDGLDNLFGKCAGPLDIHHVRYDNLGEEWLSDLRVLCRKHHEYEEERRRKLGSQLYSWLADVQDRLERMEKLPENEWIKYYPDYAVELDWQLLVKTKDL